MRRLVAISAFFVSYASACSPAPADQLFAQNADFVLVGTATETREGTRDENFDLLVRYDVLEVLSGNVPETRTGISLCRVPIRIGERLVVGSVDGQQYVYLAEISEQEVRASIRSGR